MPGIDIQDLDRNAVRLLVPDLPTHKDLSPFLDEIDTNRIYTNFGPLHTRLESELAAFLGVKHALCLSSGTSALELAVQNLHLPKGSQILIPSLNFPSAAIACIRNGHDPVFSDVDLTTGSLRTDIARQALQKNSKISAVLVSVLLGCSTECSDWEKFQADTGCRVVIDAAGAIGHIKPPNSISTIYSLHATKPLSAGEGGVLATNDAAAAKELRALSNFGYTQQGLEHVGTNSKLSEYHSAVGLAALQAWPKAKAKRLSLFSEYTEKLNAIGLPAFARVMNQTGVTSTFSLVFHDVVGERAVEDLAHAGVETRRWYCPHLHRHPAFQGFSTTGPLKNSEWLSQRLLGLPFHTSLTSADIDQVCAAIKTLQR
ncbi:aminotransferase class I/II-fold pyridoxal phosphate-dependent enzyme [Parasedimentitalea marina]|uniref:Aminotransferase class I/II-fold pyridoxal phosphate-dependent enzyme n=1 Tax=Parasedimentitalea marina TaxID=2483033 RepID=A0A3T0N463_9RHOB|nr:aminotransferase class I/II-fold pyridoxal phosphate-dependent enzyme [Parasedimentitalea marina]AZV78772.1 aminotransferase class I/II-fold pyridoxal phosphate-dependent enzyme [Parasedimentitalea marina]